jgi:hypothetical protein
LCRPYAALRLVPYYASLSVLVVSNAPLNAGWVVTIFIYPGVKSPIE